MNFVFLKQGGMALRWWRVDLGISKKFFTIRAVMPWNKLVRETVAAQSFSKKKKSVSFYENFVTEKCQNLYQGILKASDRLLHNHYVLSETQI